MSTTITEGSVIRLLDTIVSTPSVNPAFRKPSDDPAIFGEQALAEALLAWFREAEIEAELDLVAPGRPNLVARVLGHSGAPRMLWEGHLDTVQVTGMDAPFTPRVEGGRMYGRGAVDDGGCVAAFMLALRELAQDPPPGDVEFCAAIDEEYNYDGILHHLTREGKFALGVAGEPTDLRVVRACKGCVRWTVELHGRSAHTSKPQEGISAIDAGRKLLDLYEAEMARRTDAHDLLGPATLICTGFDGGEGPNTVPSTAVLRFDYRHLPTETGREVYDRFRVIADSLADHMPGVVVLVAPPFVDSSAMDVSADANVVTFMGEICETRGISATPLGVPFGSDATKMVNNADIPTIVFGPGSIDQAHAIDEFVELAQVLEAAEMLVDLARRIR